MIKSTSETVIIGLGGAGSNILADCLIEWMSIGEVAAVNTDSLGLLKLDVPLRHAIGLDMCGGDGCEGDWLLARQIATRHRDVFKKIIGRHRVVIILAGLGGGTGSGMAPYVATMALGENINCLAAVTMPLKMEGEIRRENAQESLSRLKKLCDNIIVVELDDYFMEYRKATMVEVFENLSKHLMIEIKSNRNFL